MNANQKWVSLRGLTECFLWDFPHGDFTT